MFPYLNHTMMTLLIINVIIIVGFLLKTLNAFAKCRKLKIDFS